MSDSSRYTCQINLANFGKKSQILLKNANVLVVGVGGLGCPALQYLGSAGVGKIDILDCDKVALSNLHRQILYSSSDVGEYKAEAAKRAVLAQNPELEITPIVKKLGPDNALTLVKNYDVVLDCTDNFEAREILNYACVKNDMPLVYGAALGYEGQVAIWNTVNKDGSRSPNYSDVFGNIDQTKSISCDDNGVFPTLTGIIGCMQANEAIKYLIKSKDLLTNKLVVFNSLTLETTTIKLPMKSKFTKNSVKLMSKKPTPVMSMEEVDNANEQYKLVDVRDAVKHKEFGIGGENILYEEILSGKAKIDFTKPTVFYCSTGRKSDIVVDALLEKYPEAKIYSLKNGVRGLAKKA